MFRSEASLDQLRKLNPYVNVNCLNTDLKALSQVELSSLLARFHTVIVTEVTDLTVATRINRACRENGVAFLLADVLGLFSWSFSDFGADFDVVDVDGEESQEGYIANVVVNEGDRPVIDVLDRKFHDLEDGDLVKFYEIKVLLENTNETKREAEADAQRTVGFSKSL